MKVGMVSLGCSKNLIDSEIMLGILNKNNYEIVTEPESADIIIVNTCAFIESAQQEAINTILEMAQLKKENLKKLIVTGCLAQRYKEEIINEIPEVDAIVGTGSVGEILAAVQKNDKLFCSKLENVDYLNNERVVSTNTGFAYLKIAEGCNNFCTYCIIPKLRGKYISRKIEDIIQEAKKLAQKGYKEIVLVAQDVTVYGKDLYSEKKLVELIKEISKIDGIEWIRLLYCYPEEITDEFIQEMKTNPKLLSYLDVPIQHSSNRILKVMGRRGTREYIEGVLNKIKVEIKDVILRTSLIVGFPGEDEKDFENLKDFVKNIKFDRLGVFTYSREEGTPAYNLKEQVEPEIKEKRYNEIMEIQKTISRQKNVQRLNKIYKTLVEGIADDGIFYEGRTYAEAPDIDGKIFFTSDRILNIGDMVLVRIVNADDYDLIGVVTDENEKVEFAK